MPPRQSTVTAAHVDAAKELLILSRTTHIDALGQRLREARVRRVVQPIPGGGTIEREYAAGRERMDLMIDYGGRRNIVEIKLVHPKRGREGTLAMALEQIARYDDKLQADTLHLVIFDRRAEYRAKPWPERLARETRATPAGKPVAVLWC